MPGAVDGDDTAWAVICENSGRVRADAFRVGLAGRWRTLRDATEAGSATAADWAGLMAEINCIDESDDSFETREGYRLDGWVEPLLPADVPPRDLYVCPVGRCRRKMAPTRGAKPRCELYGRVMGRPGDT
jgi:hypothetical protein